MSLPQSPNDARPALVGILVIGAALAGLLAYRAAYERAPGSDPEPLLRPVFALQDMSGATQSITQWDGRPVIVNFWATWCAPCRREIPLLKALRAEYADAGVEVIGIAILDEPEAIREFVAEMGIDYPILVGEQDAVDAAAGYGVDNLALPLTAFTDRAGRVVALHRGELHREQAIALLQKAL